MRQVKDSTILLENGTTYSTDNPDVKHIEYGRGAVAIYLKDGNGYAFPYHRIEDITFTWEKEEGDSR